MRDHGGNLDAAIAEYGGARETWLDLSTGINPVGYPIPPLPSFSWQTLPTKADQALLVQAAQGAFETTWSGVATAGAQAGIQMIPLILPKGTARVLGPTYNEHAGSLTSAGWDVTVVDQFNALKGADLAIVVNPNNPDGCTYSPDELLQLSDHVGVLVVDESFCDPHPLLSLLTHDVPHNVLILRSFGKFYGLAGLRLGFVFGPQNLIDRFQSMSGPWPVSGAAIAIGNAAYANAPWRDKTIARLANDADRLDQMLTAKSCKVLGGTTLFRLYETPDAAEMQQHLARHHVWSRIFPYSKTWMRLGLPGDENQWQHLAKALSSAFK